MNSEQKAFLELRTLPAKFTTEQTAWYLGFQTSQISTLVAVKLLKPLGKPARTGSKHFAHVVLAELRNEAWLSKACDAIVKFWANKNASRKSRPGSQPPLFDSAA